MYMVSTFSLCDESMKYLMRAEIPLDYDSGDTENYKKVYRNADVGRSQRWKKVPYLIIQICLSLSQKRKIKK